MNTTKGPEGPPDPSRTGGTRVAHPRSEFIVPTATAGGDALPTHDTTPPSIIDWTVPPASPSDHDSNLHHSDAVTLGLLGSTDTAEVHQLTSTLKQTTTKVRPFIVQRRRPRWLPWSVVLALLGIGSVRLAAIVSDTPDGMVTSAVLLATAFCGVLLVIAQLLDGTKK